MRRHGKILLWGAFAALGVSGATAYVLSGSRWPGGETTVHIAIPGAAPTGVLYRQAFEAAMLEWNETPFRFVVDNSYVDPCTGYSRNFSSNFFPVGDGDGRNSIDFRPDVCGNDFGNGVVAITLSLGSQGPLGFEDSAQSDIIFNSAFAWSIYDGAPTNVMDFRRVALHELGHVLGLSHEATVPSIMAPSLSTITRLTADDRAGAERLYGEPVTCPRPTLQLNTLVRNSLEEGDCSIQQLFSIGNDTSKVDTYLLQLGQPTTLRINMSSKALDSVILLTDLSLNPLEVFDDSNGACDVNEVLALEAGNYLVLANTYVEPEKCAGNLGPYTLTFSDSPYPLLGGTGNTRKLGVLSNALFSGHARLDSDTLSRSSFAATDRITVESRLHIDPTHVGQPGRIFVLAKLSDGRQYMRTAGKWLPYTGLGTLGPAWTGTLDAAEDYTVVRGLRGSTTGLSGIAFNVFIGYALDASPQDIHYGLKPIKFQIAPLQN